MLTLWDNFCTSLYQFRQFNKYEVQYFQMIKTSKLIYYLIAIFQSSQLHSLYEKRKSILSLYFYSALKLSSLSLIYLFDSLSQIRIIQILKKVQIQINHYVFPFREILRFHLKKIIILERFVLLVEPHPLNQNINPKVRVFNQMSQQEIVSQVTNSNERVIFQFKK
ncbi:hypothetical protein pb186bvf_004947 [Paramecium bursaria]